MGASSPDGEERADARAILAPFERAERRQAARHLLIGLGITLVALGAAAGWWSGFGEIGRAVAGFTGVVALLITLASASGGPSTEQRLARARALIEAGLTDEAVAALKSVLSAELDVEGAEPLPEHDTAAFLVAQAYDRGGATRLALESYRHYLAERPRGAWAVEARVRLEELEASRPAGVDVVRARAAEEARCPYCKDVFEDTTKTAACATCRTPHHAACYEEHGGCAVPGCGGDTVRVGRVPL